MKYFLYIYLIVICFSYTLHAQTLTGVVQDTTGIELPYTNLIASPIDAPDEQITFSIADEKGRYKLKLTKAVLYQIEVTHMGFSKLTDTLQILENTTKNYLLKESTESLEEVLIKSQMAVIVKEDTITYRTDQFKTGEERKLRDILKKLPGVEVDREGNVTVNGKPVTKLMVEGKEFFFGDPKLGVNNIPADAVDEVEALDNYSEVAFLKGLNDTDRMALNIKLKEGKKKFAFGEIEAGGGYQDRYLLNPTVFYYSPKTSVNFIGDFNNAGIKSFSMQDYINFEGGYSDMINRPNAFSIYRDDFAQFLNQQDFIFNQTDFAAGSISQDLGNKWQFDAYSIINKGRLETRTTNQITYQNLEAENEFRDQTSDQAMLFSINKVKLRYDNVKDTDVFIDLLLKHSDADATESITSLTSSRETFVNSLETPSKLDFTKNISLNRQFSYKHTTSLNTNLRMVNSTNTRDWLFNQPIFSGIIPFIPDGDSEDFNLLQHTQNKSFVAQVDAKHYWVLHNFHHIYPVVGANIFQENFFSLDEQVLADASINSFQDAGFNNDLDFRLIDVYAGMQYKTKIDKLTIRPGFILHQFNWNVGQLMEEDFSQNRAVLLPELMMRYDINSSERFNFDYNLKTNFGNAQQYANRLRLVGFNNLFQGNEDLANQRYHDMRLRYSKFNMFRGIFLNASLGYLRREESIRNITEIEGIDQIATTILQDIPENTYMVNASISKLVNKLRFGVSGNASFSDYARIINEVATNFQSNSYSYRLSFATRFKDLPNVTAAFSQNYSSLTSPSFENEFVTTTPSLEVEYRFWEDFIFKGDYRFNYFSNITQNQSNTFEIANASLFYQKESSPWGIGIDAANLLNIKFKNTNSVSQFLVNDQQIFLQPRILMLKLNYRL